MHKLALISKASTSLKGWNAGSDAGSLKFLSDKLEAAIKK
jgi:hypothetical protein